MKKILMLIALHFPIIAVSAVWNCRNEQLEIQCDSSECRSSDSFTPLDVYLNTENGKISVGMYSGVWQGTANITEHENLIVVFAKELEFSNSASNNEDFFIAIDKTDNVAVFKGSNYAMPMTCRSKSPK